MNDRVASHQSGYTLIELLLYVAIIGMLLSAVVVFMTTAVDARIKNQSIAEVDDQGALALDYMAQTIRNATSVTTPLAGTNANALTLVVPTAAASPTIFSINSGVLQVKKGTAAAVALTNSKVQVTSLTFTNLAPSGTSGAVQVSMTVSRVNSSGRNEYSYQKTFTTTAEVRP